MSRNKKEIFRLFGLTDNFFYNHSGEMSLIHDSINEKIVVSSGKKEKYIWVSPA